MRVRDVSMDSDRFVPGYRFDDSVSPKELYDQVEMAKLAGKASLITASGSPETCIEKVRDCEASGSASLSCTARSDQTMLG